MKKILVPIFALSLLGACSDPPEKEDPNNWQFNNQNNQNNQNNANNENNINNQNNNNGNDVGFSDGGTDDAGTGYPEPENHRPVAVTCDRERPPGNVDGNGDVAGECRSDADCIDGENGRCNFDRIGEVCTYDQCFEDTDCEGNSVCRCDGGWHGQNACMRGNCTTDADCPETGYCSPTFNDCGAYSGVTAYYCRTFEDECLNDSDCPDEGLGGPPYCMYSQEAEHWVCSQSHCVG